MAFISTKKVEEGLKAAIAKATEQIDRAQQQMIEEMRGTSRVLIGQVKSLESLLSDSAEEIGQLKDRVAILEARMNINPDTERT